MHAQNTAVTVAHACTRLHTPAGANTHSIQQLPKRTHTQEQHNVEPAAALSLVLRPLLMPSGRRHDHIQPKKNLIYTKTIEEEDENNHRLYNSVNLLALGAPK